jgi:hypothetical protein
MKNLNSKNPNMEKPVKNPDLGPGYAFYSKVLKKPFDSLEELTNAEKAYYAEITAKEDQAAMKKAAAKKVEDAFVALNQARKDYKNNLLKLTEHYQQDLTKLKANFENERNMVHNTLASAETAYAKELKTFTEKYPEGYHLTLKDGDFETTISGRTSGTTDNKETKNSIFSMFDWFFNF